MCSCVHMDSYIGTNVSKDTLTCTLKPCMLYVKKKKEKTIFHEASDPLNQMRLFMLLKPIVLDLQYYIILCPRFIYLKQESASESPAELFFKK